MVAGVNFVFIPENAQGEEITSKKFKDQCSLQFAYLVETIKKVIGGKEKSYTLRTPLTAWGISQAEDEGIGENEGGNTQNGENGGNTNQGGNNGSTTESVDSPTISGNTSFDDTTQVSISGPAGAEIHYTTNGSDPTAESPVYSEAFTLSETTTVKAIAIKDGLSSQVVTKYFTKNSGNGGGNMD
jgi:hypothetical protein